MLDRLVQFVELRRRWELRYAAAPGLFAKVACFAGYYVDLYKLKEEPTFFQRALHVIARPLAQLKKW